MRNRRFQFKLPSQQLAVFQPGLVVEVMGDDPGKCERKVGILETLCKSGPRGRLRSCRLPQAPGFGRALPDHGIRTVQQSVVNVDDIARAIGGWYGGQEPVPLFGEEQRHLAGRGLDKIGFVPDSAPAPGGRR